MERSKPPVSPADYDPERHYDERGAERDPVLDAKQGYDKNREPDEQPIDPLLTYGTGSYAPPASHIPVTEERVDWHDQPADQPAGRYAAPDEPTAQTDAPSDHRATDARIYEAVSEAIRQHGQLDLSEMTIYVALGVVTLTGTVDEHGEKQAAEDLARAVPGVQDVRNMLYVAQEGEQQPGTLPTEGPHLRGGMPSQVGETSASTSQSKSVEVEATPIANAATTQRGTVGQAEAATVMVDPGPGAIRETTPVTAVTDEAGRTTGLKVVEGMEVVGVDGKAVGHIKEVRISDFRVGRTLARDVYAPFECVQAIEGNRVTLMVKASEVGDQGWANA